MNKEQAEKLYNQPFEGFTNAFPTSRCIPAPDDTGEEWQDAHGDVQVMYYFSSDEIAELATETADNYPWDFDHVVKIGHLLDDGCIEWDYTPYANFQ